MATNREVAEWMAEQVEARGHLYRIEALHGIVRNFGDEFTYRTDAGNIAISKNVMQAFARITKDKVIYQKWMRRWDWL